MSAADQEGIVIMILLVGAVIGWGYWMSRVLRQWQEEDERWEEHKRKQRRVIEARRQQR
jgi:predicted negative regulator of RcsB-dependent stress response